MAKKRTTIIIAMFISLIFGIKVEASTKRERDRKLSK